MLQSFCKKRIKVFSSDSKEGKYDFMVKQRGRTIQWLLISIFLFILLFIPIGEGNLLVVLIEYSSIIFNPTSWHYPYTLQLVTIPLYLLSFIILLLLILISIKKTYSITLKILAIVQFALYIIISLVYVHSSLEFADSYAVVFTVIILMNLSLLQVVNLFFISPKRYKRASIVASSIVLLFLSIYSVLFWTVSRFEFELNDDGQSYSIVSIESDIPTIRIPSTYKGLPVTKISSNYYVYENIREIIFEEDSNIEIIENWSNGCKLTKITLPSSLNTIGENAFSACYQLEEVIIPINVINIERRAFVSDNLIVYCEAESKPDTWHEYWCYDYEIKEIIWGYKG